MRCNLIRILWFMFILCFFVIGSIGIFYALNRSACSDWIYRGYSNQKCDLIKNIQPAVTKCDETFICACDSNTSKNPSKRGKTTCLPLPPKGSGSISASFMVAGIITLALGLLLSFCTLGYYCKNNLFPEFSIQEDYHNFN